MDTPVSDRLRSGLRGWLPMIGLSVHAVVFTPGPWPAWALMWVLAGAIYAGCRWLTWRRAKVTGAPWWRHAGYLIAWPGLDAVSFLTRSATAPPTAREWVFAAIETGLGIALFFAGGAAAFMVVYGLASLGLAR